MSGINEEREKQIQDLDMFIQTTQERLDNIVSGLGWTLESVSNEIQTMVTCPFNNGHRVGEKSLEDHLEKCQWKAEGYTELDPPLSEPCPSVNSSSSIKFDEQLQDVVLLRAKEENPTMCIAIAPAAGVADRLIPRTSDRLMASFTSDERKAIYDYVIAKTIKPDIGDDIADMNRVAQKDGDHPKTSLLELLAQERNLKRRRAKHRGVHTNKKSQVEILREVIHQQMEMYEEYLADSSVKYEPKSPNVTVTSSLDSQASVERKNHQQTEHEAEWRRNSASRGTSRSSNRYYDRTSNEQTFLPAKRSPASDFDFDRDRKRNRSESRERGRKKHHSRHKRDRSKERNRHEAEEGSGRHRIKEEKSRSKDEDYRSENKNDRRKRHESRDESNNYIEKSRRREESGDKYCRDQKKVETDKNRKRNR